MNGLENQLIGIVMDLFLAGTETTAISIGLIYLLIFPWRFL